MTSTLPLSRALEKYAARSAQYCRSSSDGTTGFLLLGTLQADTIGQRYRHRQTTMFLQLSTQRAGLNQAQGSLAVDRIFL